ncbi:MAG: DUF4163 domain-containing protein [Lachnospiraceae bacterium]|nr:DUF4163 domain-containing protein [Lachnospiraceae bacterium]
MRKKNGIKKLFLLIALVFCVSLTAKTGVSAASSAKYTTKTKNLSKTYGSVTANVYYKRVVLKGKSDIVSKINKSIKADMNEFLSSDSVDTLYSCAKSANSAGWKDTYYYTATSKVTYNGSGIISIQVTTMWYAGGVSNIDRYGLTYDLKTGKKLNLVNVCSGNSTKVKTRVLNKIRKDSSSSQLNWTVLNAYPVKKMDFYINKNGNAVVCFGPYEIATGGWYRTFTIKSKYS